MIHLITTGVVGKEELLNHLYQHRGLMKAFTLEELTASEFAISETLDTFRYVGDAPREGRGRSYAAPARAAVDFIIDLEYPWDKEELKNTSLVDSPAFQRVLKIWQDNLISLAGYHGTVYVIGQEHGLGFVPMQAAHREEIRRATAIQAATSQQASLYQIMFAGLNPLTVLDRQQVRQARQHEWSKG